MSFGKLEQQSKTLNVLNWRSTHRSSNQEYSLLKSSIQISYLLLPPPSPATQATTTPCYRSCLLTSLFASTQSTAPRQSTFHTAFFSFNSQNLKVSACITLSNLDTGYFSEPSVPSFSFAQTDLAISYCPTYTFTYTQNAQHRSLPSFIQVSAQSPWPPQLQSILLVPHSPLYLLLLAYLLTSDVVFFLSTKILLICCLPSLEWCISEIKDFVLFCLLLYI